jgi:hypothetical protein
MSRILKRPMFRIGGQANEDGIISMVVPHRGHYADKGTVSTDDNYDEGDLKVDSSGNIDTSTLAGKNYARNLALLKAAAGQGRSQDERLSDLLIRGGLNLASQRPTGNILSTAASAFKEPTEQYLKGGPEEQNLQRQLRLGAASAAISSEDAQALQRLKIKQMYANQTRENLIQQYSKTLSSHNVNAINQNAYDVATRVTDFKLKNPQMTFAGIPQPTGKDKNGKAVWKPSDLQAIPDGTTYLDPLTGLFKLKTKEGISIIDEKTGAVIAQPKVATPTSTPIPQRENPQPWNKQRFYEELYRNNPDLKPKKETAEAPVKTDTDIG